MTNRLLTVAEAATYARVSAGTLNKLRCCGAGPKYLKPTGRVLYQIEDLDRWLLASARNSTSDEPQRKCVEAVS